MRALALMLLSLEVRDDMLCSAVSREGPPTLLTAESDICLLHSACGRMSASTHNFRCFELCQGNKRLSKSYLYLQQVDSIWGLVRSVSITMLIRFIGDAADCD